MAQREWVHKYFTIREFSPAPKRKTCTYVLANSSTDSILGAIKWYGPWRQFTFQPMAGTVWNDDCLEIIGDFLGKLNHDYRNGGTQ